jgi:hypothetical protein
MASIINAVASTGISQSADGSGIIKIQSSGVTTNALAWVNFVGSSGTITSSYNVSSVTRNGTGDFTVNLATTMTDANYSVIGTVQGVAGGATIFLQKTATNPTTTSYSIYTVTIAGVLADSPRTYSAIFGN